MFKDLKDDDSTEDALATDDPTQDTGPTDPTATAAPTDPVDAALANLDKQASSAQKAGVDQSDALRAQAAQVAVSPEELKRSRYLDAVNQIGKISEIGADGASQFHDRKYDNPASQKIYDQLTAQRQADMDNRTKLAGSLTSQAAALRNQPLQDLENRQTFDQNGLKQVSEVQGLKNQALAKNNAVATGAILQKTLQQRYPDADIPPNLNVSDAKQLNDIIAGDPDYTLSSAEKTSDGVFATTLNKRTGETNKIRLGGNPDSAKLANKPTLDDNIRKETAKIYNNDEGVKAANKAVTAAQNLKGLADGNDLQQSMTKIGAVKAEVGPGKINSQELQQTGLMGTLDQLESLASKKSGNGLSPKEQQAYEQLADGAEQQARALLDSRARYIAQQQAKVYKGKADEDSLYDVLRPGGASTTPRSTTTPTDDKLPPNSVWIKDSNGVTHPIDKSNIDIAKQRDPGLTVLGE